MFRNWPAVAVLCVATMIGAAGCTSSASHEAAGSAQSASAGPSTAESVTASPSPVTSSAAPSEPAQPSPTHGATSAGTGTTKKPTSTAAGAPAAPAGVRVTSVELFLLDGGISGPCGATLPVKMVATVHLSAPGRFPGKIQVHSSDGHDPAPVSFTAIGDMSVNLSASITVDPARLQRTVDFWVETLEPTRMTSPRSTYSMKCLPRADVIS